MGKLAWFVLFSAGSGGWEGGRRVPAAGWGARGQDPCCPPVLPLSTAGAGSCTPDSPARGRTPQRRSSPSGLRTSCLSQNGTPGLSPGGEENKGLKSRNRFFFAVLHQNRWLQQVLCLTLLLPQMPGLCLKVREIKTQHCKQAWGFCPMNPAALHSSRHIGCRLSMVHGAALPLALTPFAAVKHHGQAWGGCSRRQGPMASAAHEMSLARLRSHNPCWGIQSSSCSVLQEPVCPKQPCACQTEHQSVI